MATQEKHLSLPRLQLENLVVKVVGETELITNRFPNKVKDDLDRKRHKKATTGDIPRTPEEEYQDSIHRMPDGSCGFPAGGLKKAMVRAATDLGMKMTDMRRAFHVDGELMKIDAEPHMRSDVVRVPPRTGAGAIRHRAGFWPWSITLSITYNSAVISAEQLIALLETAGFGVGLGEWRPDRDGGFGRFRVARGGE